jgi:phosphatidylglycerol:prolipoprotein diacylglycerol transferase
VLSYFEWKTLSLGPIALQVWGLFVALGIGLGLWVAAREVRRRGLDVAPFMDMATIALFVALVMARVVHVVVYAPEYYFAAPAKIFAVWEGGLSSFGGFLGALVGVLGYLGYRKWIVKHPITRDVAYRYADAAMYALPLGYGCGRIGCFLIHDHPGTLSSSLLAVQYPGGARLDHGLLLALFGFGLFGIFWLLRRRFREKMIGFFLPLFLVVYGTVRFCLDFFRAYDLPGSDVRYGLFTPAQYGCVLLIVVGVAYFTQRKVQQK